MSETINAFDSAVFGQIDTIRRIGYRYLRTDEVDDFVQDVLLRVYAHRTHLRDNVALPAWIGKIARNAAFDLNGKRRAEPLDEAMGVPSPERTPYEHVERNERRQLLENALNRLDDIDRDLLSSYYVDRVSYDVLSERYGISYGATRFRMYQARQRLKKLLGAILGLGGIVTARTVEGREAKRASVEIGGSMLWFVAATAIVVIGVSVGLIFQARRADIAEASQASQTIEQPISLPMGPVETKSVDSYDSPNTAISKSASKDQPVAASASAKKSVASAAVATTRVAASEETEDIAVDEVSLARQEVDDTLERFRQGFILGDEGMLASTLSEEGYTHRITEPDNRLRVIDGSDAALESALRLSEKFQIDFQLRPHQMELLPDNTARFETLYQYYWVPMSPSDESKPILIGGTMTFTLERRGDEWRIRHIDERKTFASS